MRVLRRSALATVAVCSLVAVAAPVGAVPSARARFLSLRSRGHHVHHGNNGEVDVNVCSDDVGPAIAHCNAHVRTDTHRNAFVGTYGGFSYIAPLYGVPSVGLYTEKTGFAQNHLSTANRAFAAPEFGTFTALPLHGLDGIKSIFHAL